MLKVATALPREPYREYKDVERVYSGSAEIDKILDKNGNVLFAVNKEVEGTPAITYKGKEETNLKNYRIYGNTVNGESVGDRTGNLFDGFSVYGMVPSVSTGELINSPSGGATTDFIAIDNGDITLSKSNAAQSNMYIFLYAQDKSYIGYSQTTAADTLILYGNSINGYQNAKYARIRVDVESAHTQTNIMLNTGSEPLPYEPYGYRVPVTVEGKNLCNNIWEQGEIDGNTGNVVSNPNIVCCDFIPVKPDVTYSCSRTIANNFINLRCYGANKNYLGTGATLANKGNPLAYGDLFGTFMITDARVSYIRFNDISNSLDTKYMLVEGVYTAETMPPYEPYHAPITTPIYLPEPIKMVGDEAEYIDYAEQKQHRVRKNLLQNTATSTTKNGVTFTVNSDGSVTCNGTADKAAWFAINRSFDVYSPDGRIASIGNQGSLDTFYMNIGFVSGNVINSQEYSKTTHNNSWVHIVIASGYTCDNLTLYPMIRKAGIVDDTYEPYIENTEVDVTLPALPVLPGTNTLTVGTEVQPSNVYLKGRIKEIT